MRAKAKQLPSGSYRVRVTYLDEEGNKYYESFTRRTKTEAEAAAEEFRVNKTNKKKPENKTLGEAMDEYIDSHDGAFSPSTIASYRGIRKFAFPNLVNVRLGLLTQLMIQNSVNKHRNEHTEKTTKNAVALLRSTLKVHKLDDLCKDVVIKKGKAKEIEIPTEEELDKFIEKIKGSRLYIYTMLACYGGLRRGEVVALTWKDIDFKKKLINIDKVKVKNQHGEYEDKETPKTEKSTRKIPIVAELLDALQARVKENGFSNSDLVVESAPDAMKDAYERARIKYQFPYNYHSLRHYFTSYLDWLQ